jgi:microcystin-dependent protein
MLPEPQVLRRSPYLIPPATELEHSVRTHYEDWEHYHLPLACLHHAYLHDWGIAGGLQVLVNPQNPNEVEVQPGVAIDGAGKLIALSSSGLADVGADQPVTAPFRLSTQGLANALRYLVIRFGERLNFNEQKHEQLPVLRLVATSGAESYVDDGSAIILAVVQTDGTGVATVLPHRLNELAYGRRLLGSQAQQLELRRAALSATGVVEAAVVGRIAAHEGELRITVSSADDSMMLAREGGSDFDQLVVNARQTNLQGNLVVGSGGNGILSVRHIDGKDWQSDASDALYLNWQTGKSVVIGSSQAPADLVVTGNVGIGTAEPAAKLDVDGDLRLLSGVAVSEFSSDNSLSGESHTAVPTVRAVKEYVDNLLIGSVAAFATDTPPVGWLECNGFALPREGVYANLFARIGTRFGEGNGATTFNVPDLRGQFIRGWAHGAQTDPDRNSRVRRISGGATGDAVGSYQADAYRIHNHTFTGNFGNTASGLGSHNHSGDNRAYWQESQPNVPSWLRAMKNYSWTISGANFTWTPSWGWIAFTNDAAVDFTNLAHSHQYTPTGSISNSGGSEVRPTNASLMFCIKY